MKSYIGEGDKDEYTRRPMSITTRLSSFLTLTKEWRLFIDSTKKIQLSKEKCDNVGNNNDPGLYVRGVGSVVRDR